jgi:hypothetical protein
MATKTIKFLRKGRTLAKVDGFLVALRKLSLISPRCDGNSYMIASSRADKAWTMLENLEIVDKLWPIQKSH